MNDTKITRNRGRPRQFDPDQAIDDAIILFNARGFEGVSIADLCARIGIKATSLYAAYGSKLDLYHQAVEHYAEEAGRLFGAALDRADSVPAAVRAVLECAAIAYTADPRRPGCLVLNGATMTADQAAIDILRAKSRQTQALIQARLDALGAREPELLSGFIVTIMRGLSAAARDGQSRDRLLATVALVMAGAATSESA